MASDQVRSFRESLKDDLPPSNAKGPLEAHWHVGKGRLAKALELIDRDASKDAAWVRAHLHRRKGEKAEAAKWYERAGRSPSQQTVDQEWDSIAAGLLLHI
ncbi:MAG TPA: hypothetical protein VFK86_04550 [Bauldia sp.]|nr:hypothetical protein [Bauldia sp.]